jgi:hypothetical protein
MRRRGREPPISVPGEPGVPRRGEPIELDDSPVDGVRYTQPPEFGRIPWVKRMKCLRDADSVKALDACR